MGGKRGKATLHALRDQLGLDAVAIKAFGLEGSAGSTPLRITLGHAARTTSSDQPLGAVMLFGKLYAENHLRSDHWYKLFRTLSLGASRTSPPLRSTTVASPSSASSGRGPDPP